MRFRATLELGGKTATGIRVPEEVVEALGAGRRPKVTVTLGGGYSYRTTVAPMGGVSYVPVAAEHREAAGLSAGDELEVDLELDTAPREVVVPEDFAAALAADATAREAYERLSYSNRRRYVLVIEEAKTAETRARRIAKIVAELTSA